jgi:hypothetical protein
MTQTTDDVNAEISQATPDHKPHLSAFEMVATGVTTGLIATVIFETGRGAVSLLAKNPLVIFGAGIATGYFARKYRKGILLTGDKIAHQSKEFALRQKRHIDELLTSEDEA